MTQNDTTTDDAQPETRTIEIERTQDVVTVRTDLDVPSKYPALPVFAGEGWHDADLVKQNPESAQYRIEDGATGATLRFTPHWERSDRLAPNHYHNERQASDTFEVGDFLVDYRNPGRNDRPQLQVRVHPNITDPDPKVVVEPLGESQDQED